MNQVIYEYILIVFLLILVLYRHLFSYWIQKFVFLLLIFSLFFNITRNAFLSFLSSIIITLFYDMIEHKICIYEKFDNGIGKASDKGDENVKDFIDYLKDGMNNIKETQPEKSMDPIEKLLMGTESEKSLENIQKMMERLDGNVPIHKEDKEETNKLGIPLEKYKNEKVIDPLKKAQMDTYALIDTINALKDTITTLSPVLSEGKKLMGMFESLKI